MLPVFWAFQGKGAREQAVWWLEHLAVVHIASSSEVLVRSAISMRPCSSLRVVELCSCHTYLLITSVSLPFWLPACCSSPLSRSTSAC